MLLLNDYQGKIFYTTPDNIAGYAIPSADIVARSNNKLAIVLTLEWLDSSDKPFAITYCGECVTDVHSLADLLALIEKTALELENNANVQSLITKEGLFNLDFHASKNSWSTLEKMLELILIQYFNERTGDEIPLNEIIADLFYV